VGHYQVLQNQLLVLERQRSHCGSRTEHANIWVDKSDKTLHFSPDEIDCGNWWGWLSE
jgi:hypothetical protein